MKKKIQDWLNGDQDYTEGVDLYTTVASSVPGARVTIFPREAQCERCKQVLKIKLEELLSANTDTTIPAKKSVPEAPVTEALKPEYAELAAANLNAMSYAALKSLFLKLELEAPSLKRADIQPVLEAEQSKLK